MLSEMSIEALRELQKALETAILNHKRSDRSTRGAAVDGFAPEIGFSIDKSPDRVRKLTKVPSTIRYRHPADRSVTWTGRGRKPSWFKAHIDAGRDPAELEV
ncbi:MAG: H-NS family nucleoid-associated regulatory protein [Paracoccaceae bacterium]|jgi:DNA-binding protein H-NS